MKTKQLLEKWKEKELKELCEIVSGATPKTSNKEFWGGNIFWITPKDLSKYNNKYIDKTARTITQKGYDSCSARMIEPNNVLMSSRAPIGYLVINKVPICTNQGFKSFIVKNDSLNPEYLYYYLKSIVEKIKNAGSGTTFNELSKTKAGLIKIIYPTSLLLQQKIVSAIETQFSRLDEVVENLRSVKRKLGVYRKAVLKKGFEKGEETSLGETFEIVMGQSPPSEFYNKEGKGLPFFQGKKEFESKYPRIENWTTKYNKEVDKGDLLVSVRAPIGPCNIAPEKCAIGRGIAAIKASNEIESLFAFYLIKYNGQGLDSKGTGTTFKAISKTSLNSFVTNIPDKKDWEEIVQNIEEKFSVIDKVEEAVEGALVKAERLRKAVLKVAFEGRLVK